MVDELFFQDFAQKINVWKYNIETKMASGDAQQAPQKDAARPHKSPKPKINPSTANIRKRQPRRLPKRKNDIYVTRKSNFASQMEQCEKLFDGGEKEVYIHGLGAAINRALNIALQLESRSLGTLQVAISTSTVDLVDDIEPLCDEGDFDTRERSNSAVHIRVFRTESKKEDVPNKWCGCWLVSMATIIPLKDTGILWEVG